MNRSARVLSVRELAEFRGFLVKFGEGVRHGLTTADSEVQETSRWLTGEHPARLAAAQRKVKRQHELALDELRRKRLQPTATGAPASVVYEQKVAAQAKAKLEWLDERVAATRRWARQFSREADQYRAATQAARGVADSLVPRALARLEGHLRALENYLQSQADASTPHLGDVPGDRAESVARADGDSGLDVEAQAATADDGASDPHHAADGDPEYVDHEAPAEPASETEDRR